ncbi:MAG: 50S ribosomal protein L17 [Chloroflexi bacterium]|nr:50S ribosomal protein L17 [Chloroflexota bacterium]
MRHAVVGRNLSRRPGHRLALRRNLAAELIKRERITTTEAKAKEVRGLAEQIITRCKAGTVHDRRVALSLVPNTAAVKKAFAELASRYAERKGGYTRIMKLGPRQGDAAPMVVLELVP